MSASRLGARVSFVGCVGNDRIGDTAEVWLRRDKVDTKYLIRHPEVPSGVGFILLAKNGVPGMVVSMGANAELSESMVEAAIQEYSSVGFGLAWDAQVFRYAWIWQALGGGIGYPWYGRTYAMGLEPWTSYPCAGLQAAVERGTSLSLNPGAHPLLNKSQ
jgi:hypothetical protein